MSSWKPGTQIVYQELWREQLLVARPVTVVRDDGRLLALYTHPGARYRSAALGTARYGMSFEARIEAMLADRLPPHSEQVGSDRHVLVLGFPRRWYAVWLFWSARWEHAGWYVNLQRPLRRTAHAVQVRDCALDLVVRADRSWSWKDRDEFAALCEHRFFEPRVAERIERAAARAVRAIERWEAPFRDGWERWRPEPSWAVPELPPDWQVTRRGSGTRPRAARARADRRRA
jgi:hypothetical protein